MILVLTVIRFLAPLLIFRKPRLTIILMVLADSFDYQFFPRTGNWYEVYARWDKAFDMYGSLVWLKYSQMVWHEPLLRKAGYGLFLLRLIGVGLFEMSSLRFWLFVFPNVFDSFFIFRELFQKSSQKIFTKFKELSVSTALVVLTSMKLIQEYFVHITQVFPWQSPLGRFIPGEEVPTTYLNAFIWVFVFIFCHWALLNLVVYLKQKATPFEAQLTFYLLLNSGIGFKSHVLGEVLSLRSHKE